MKSRIRYWGIVAIFSGVAITGAAQPWNINYTYLTPSEGDLKDEVEQHEAKLEGAVPVLTPDQDSFALSVGGAFQVNVWDFEDSRIDTIDLYKVKAPVKGTFQATERIPVTVSLVPGIHSDFKDVDEDDFRLEGSAMATFIYSETVTFRLGLGYGEDFGEPQVFPLGGVSWKPTDSLQMDFLIPAPKIAYALSEKTRIFLCGAPAGGEWNVGDDGERQVDVRQEGYRVGLGAECQVVKNGWFYVMAGSESGRKVSVALDDNAVVDDRDIDDAAFVQIGFKLN